MDLFERYPSNFWLLSSSSFVILAIVAQQSKKQKKTKTIPLHFGGRLRRRMQRPRSSRIIVGVTGFLAAGKGALLAYLHCNSPTTDSFADYLIQRKGFIHLSLSDIIREELKQRRMETTIANLVLVRKAWRYLRNIDLGV
jgi:hypothetical protein